MMKKILMFLFVSSILLSGCSSKNDPSKLFTNLNDIAITYSDSVISNNAIPVGIISEKEIKDLNIQLLSESPVQISHDIMRIQLAEGDASEKIPWFVWANDTDFDWSKQAEASNIQFGEDDKIKAWDEYFNPYQKQYENANQENVIHDYYAYEGCIYLDDLFTSDTYDIDAIRISDGDTVLKEVKVNINKTQLENNTETVKMLSGHAFLNMRTFPSYHQVYVNDFNLISSDDIILKSIKMYDEDLEVAELQIKASDKEYKVVDPDNIGLPIAKDSEFILRPDVRTKDEQRDAIFTRNYIYCLTYEVNGNEESLYFDSGVITSYQNFDELYHLQDNSDYKEYLNCLLYQNTHADMILTEFVSNE